MLDYGEILDFLAKNPPQHDAERKVHASMLELMAQCLRETDNPEKLSCSTKQVKAERPLDAFAKAHHSHPAVVKERRRA